MSFRRGEWDQVHGNHESARYRLQEAQRLYDEAVKELKPGELYPGVSEVMLRRSARQKYKKVLICTPRLNASAITFVNNKSAYVSGPIKQSENPQEPFLWITLESKPEKKKREFRERLARAGVK